jgi:hypothetical protein
VAEPKPIHWAAGLVVALKATFTGQAKLDLILAAMAARWNDPAHAGKPGNHPDRHLTAAEAVAVLVKAGAGEVTLMKARQLAETGEYVKPAPVNPADLLPPPPDGPAPVRGEDVAPEPEMKSIAGTVDIDASADTIGLKPIEPVADKVKAGKKPKGEAKPKAGKKPKGVKDLLPASEPADASGSDAGSADPGAAVVEGASGPVD